jgi:hypothetical protein
MLLAKPTRLRTWLFLLLVGSSSRWPGGAAAAQDHRIDRLGGTSWSPDSGWLAFNWPERPDLFIISLKTGRSFTLRPAGDLGLDRGQVFASVSPSGSSDPRHTSWIVASPGQDKLTPLQWSSNSVNIAYQVDTKTNAIFSVLEESITHRLAATDVPPWLSPDELRTTLQFVVPTKDRPERYRMRIERLDGAIVKEIAFDDLRELRQVASARYHDTSFLSANHQFVLYPRVTSNGWRIMREPLDGSAPPQSLTKPDPREPYQWQLSGDDRFLAVVQGDALTVGARDDWGRAKTISLAHDSVTISWSPDGRFLGLLDHRSLFVLPRDGDQLKLVTENCAQRFWGWRGSRLFFGDPRTDLTNLSCIDAEHPGPPTQILKARKWETATRDVWLSPDGLRVACVVAEIDYMGRAVWQLWESAVQTNAQWQLMYELKPQ